MTPKAPNAALASAAPVGAVTCHVQCQGLLQNVPRQLQGAGWAGAGWAQRQCTSRVQAAESSPHVGTGCWAGSRLDTTFLTHKVWQEPLGTAPAVIQGTQGSLQPHTEPWPELPSPPTPSPVCCTKLSWLPGAHATAIRAAQAPHSTFWTDPSTTARGQRGWIPTMPPGTPW